MTSIEQLNQEINEKFSRLLGILEIPPQVMLFIPSIHLETQKDIDDLDSIITEMIGHLEDIKETIKKHEENDNIRQESGQIPSLPGYS